LHVDGSHCKYTLNALFSSVLKIDQFRESLEAVQTKEPPEEKKDPGLVTMEDVKPYYTADQKAKLLEEFQVSSVETSAAMDLS